MLIGLTGTPGTGKTSVGKILEKRRGWKVIYLNDLIKEEKLYSEVDEKRDAVVADMELVRARLAEVLESERKGKGGESKSEKGKEEGREGEKEEEEGEEEIIILESHLAHHIADTVIVLRAYPPELKKRLEKRGYSEEKVNENAEAEAIDLILVEAAEWCEKVYEVNSTGRTAEESAGDVEKIIDCLAAGNEEKEGELEEFRPGSLDWIDSVP